MTRLKDIAEKAGVSIPTANQILNGYRTRFADATCEKVLKAAEELSYKPNIMARSLQARKSFTVGILFFEANYLYASEFARSVQSVLTTHHYAPITLTHACPEEEKTNLEICLERRVDGLIVNTSIDNAPNSILANEYAKLLKNEKRPLIEIFGSFIEGVPSFHLEHSKYGYELTQRLIHKGCRKVAFLTHSLMEKAIRENSKRFWNAQDMLQGYRKAMREHGLEPIPLSHHLDNETDAEGCFYWNTYNMAEMIFGKDLALDGLVCFNDEQALALVNYGHHHGIDFNKFAIATMRRKANRVLDNFPVENIAWPTDEIGRQATSKIMEMIG